MNADEKFSDTYNSSFYGFDCLEKELRAVCPIEDALCFLHRAVGCSFNARSLFTLHDNRSMRLLSTGIEGKHIVFGGEEVLGEGLEKAIETVRPELVVVLGTCIPTPSGGSSCWVTIQKGG